MSAREAASGSPPASGIRRIESPDDQHLRELVDKQRRGVVLTDTERMLYEVLRDDFARALSRAQGIPIEPGVRPSVRHACSMKVQLSHDGRRETTLTLEVATGGFTALLGAPLRVGSYTDFVLGSE